MRYRLTPLLAIAVLFILLAPVYWLRVHAGSDGGEVGPAGAYLFHYVYPAYSHAFERLAEGELPLWNARQLCGTPLLADFRIGVFDPLRLPFLFLPPERAMVVTAFIGLAGMGFFMALAARSMGTGYLPSLLAGLAYAFCGTAAAAAAHPHTTSALFWGGFSLWAVRAFAGGGRLTLAFLLALGWGVLLLSGSPLAGLALIAFQLAYALWLTWDRERPGGLRVSGTVASLAALALAGALAAAQWAPSLAFARIVHDPAGWLFRWQAPAQPAQTLREGLLQFLSAGRPATELAEQAGLRLLYFGALPLLLLVAALFHRKRRELVFLVPATAALLAGALALGLRGEWGLAAGLTVPAAQAVGLLTALGAHRLMETRFHGRPVSAMLPAVATAAVGFALIYLASGRTRGAFIVAVALVITISVVRVRWFIALAGCGLAALLFADLALALSNPAPHPFSTGPAVYKRYEAALRQARREASTGRVALAGDGWEPALSPNLGLLEGFDGAGGAFLPMTKPQAAWWRKLVGESEGDGSLPDMLRPAPSQLSLRFLEAMAVRRLAAPAGGAWAEASRSDGDLRLRRVGPPGGADVFALDDALPRAFWVGGWEAVEGPTQAADWIASAENDLSAACCVDRASARLLDAPKATPEDFLRPLSVEMTSPEAMRLEFEAPEPGLAVVCDTLAPGWRAKLDGRTVPLLRVNGLFRGVSVGEGSHVLTMRYEAPGFALGRTLSLSALGVVCLAGVSVLAGRFAAARRRRKTP